MTTLSQSLFVILAALTAHADSISEPLPSRSSVDLQGRGHGCEAGSTICSPRNTVFYKECIRGRYRFKHFSDCESCKMGDEGRYYVDDKCDYTVRIDNLAFRQPLSGIFVMTHDDKTEPLFQFNKPASAELAILAEDGNPGPLVTKFKDAEGVKTAFAVGGPVPPGGFTTFNVSLSPDMLLSLATMAVNTNDAFVSLNGVEVNPEGSTFYLPGLDAGSEDNNELCSFIPGPACPAGSGNLRDTDGAENYVHVHRGFFGINEGKTLPAIDLGVSGNPLAANRYDWRNPMVRVYITEKW
eukprot:1394453-Amorphochlora_amoeboformis.AAC.2